MCFECRKAAMGAGNFGVTVVSQTCRATAVWELVFLQER